MSLFQPGIFAAPPRIGRYLFFSIRDPQSVRDALMRLAGLADGDAVVLGLGPELFDALGRKLPGLREFPAMSGHGVEVPSTPTALWCWLRGAETGELMVRGREIEKAASPGLHLDRAVDAFKHAEGRDLTGYEDGTENPKGADAEAAAFVQGQGAGLDGASFVAVQQWMHDFSAFDALSGPEQDDSIGRRRSDNEELEDAPESSHVKRTAQESFDPEAFVLRRSMPWVMGTRAGLVFVAFGSTLDSFEAQMRRMAGQEDGITDALFRFSKPLSGAYLWCPPMRAGRVDLSAAGL